VLNYISTAHAETSLQDEANLIDTDYPTGVKMTDEEMARFAVHHHI